MINMSFDITQDKTEIWLLPVKLTVGRKSTLFGMDCDALSMLSTESFFALMLFANMDTCYARPEWESRKIHKLFPGSLLSRSHLTWIFAIQPPNGASSLKDSKFSILQQQSSSMNT